MNKTIFFLLVAVSLSIIACNNPKVIEANPDEGQIEFIHPDMQNPHEDQVEEGKHTVEVLEVLQAEKYSYIRAKEDGKEMWLVSPRMNIKKGASYSYEGGLLKKNYKSVEFDRNFEEIYLVSNLRPVASDNEDSAMNEAFHKMNETQNPHTPAEVVEGTTSLADIFSDPKAFEGKRVTVSGKCVKVNNQIMMTNWVHIEDGTKTDGETNDLTITTSATVYQGQEVNFEGVIALDRDFGAGYRYAVIMENAEMVK